MMHVPKAGPRRRSDAAVTAGTGGCGGCDRGLRGGALARGEGAREGKLKGSRGAVGGVSARHGKGAWCGDRFLTRPGAGNGQVIITTCQLREKFQGRKLKKE